MEAAHPAASIYSSVQWKYSGYWLPGWALPGVLCLHPRAVGCPNFPQGSGVIHDFMHSDSMVLRERHWGTELKEAPGSLALGQAGEGGWRRATGELWSTSYLYKHQFPLGRGRLVQNPGSKATYVYT